MEVSVMGKGHRNFAGPILMLLQPLKCFIVLQIHFVLQKLQGRIGITDNTDQFAVIFIKMLISNNLINQSINQSISEWVSESINQSINESVDGSINQSINRLTARPHRREERELTWAIARSLSSCSVISLGITTSLSITSDSATGETGNEE